ncbi:NADP-dependent oxidoreductase domain-containing protein [Xylogone sp. PMI_703]|nr:NADP-dependent oxidoreductase domain-containing protein [Xylogone sp. PMI_703]
MPINSPLDIVLGAGNIGDTSIDTMARFNTPDEVNGFLDAFYARGGRHIDTARGYSPHAPGTSEPRLGIAEAGKKFIIDTKVVSSAPGSHAKDKIEQSVNDSLAALKVPQVHIEYLHHPDRQTPFEETLEAMNKAYKEGKFQKFGLSNYTADEVEKILSICEERGFVKPSVYQGQYNPIVRGGEKELFPVLRKHGMAFYAWSPAAAGFFAGNYKHVQHGGRYDTSHRLGQIYSSNYLKPSIEAATDKAIGLVQKHGINGHAAALRWTVYHSKLDKKYGDSVIIGASSPAQLNSNIDMIEQGPLPQEVVDAMDDLYKHIEADAMPYHF